MNSLAALRTDTIAPLKINPYLTNSRDEQNLSPLSQSTSTTSTPFFTPRSSLSPVSPINPNGASIFGQFMVISDVGPTPTGHVSKPLNPSFRPLLGSILNSGDVLPASETAQGNQNKPVIISRSMLAAGIIRHLINSGCPDVTDKLDLGQRGTHPIAGGGFGDIYQGVLVGGTKVAIKCPRLFLRNDDQGNKILKATAREIYAWSKLRHPNILELIGFSTFRGQISIVSSWMENGTLPEYVSKHPEADRFQLCTQVSAGLAYLHRSDIVHGDVKGSNVLASGSGVAKLADFGNTVLKKYGTLDFTETTGGPRISVRWTAPELLKAGGKHTKESDIYALDFLCEQAHAQEPFSIWNLRMHKETATGKTPFGGKSEQVVLGSVLQGKTPECPGELDLTEKAKGEALWKLMSRCWSHTVANRPRASQIEHIVSGFNDRGGVSFNLPIP
ncbi:hypothetical protein FRC08_005994 [Ceratobasidium sp. 394]|nr:hypothetical protein FRC08_005994 [Ceratobasidium sp. 394]